MMTKQEYIKLNKAYRAIADDDAENGGWEIGMNLLQDLLINYNKFKRRENPTPTAPGSHERS